MFIHHPISMLGALTAFIAIKKK